MLNGLPIHPFLVHIPLVMGVLAPLVALVLVFALAGHRLHHRAWWLVVLLYAIGFAGAVVAVETGENEHDKVHDVVAEEPLHRHEERGEQYRLGLGLTLLLSAGAGVAFGNRTWGMRLAGLTVVAGVVVAWLAVRVGHSGGLLVFQEGAASYYVAPPGPAAPMLQPAAGDPVMARDTLTDGHDHAH